MTKPIDPSFKNSTPTEKNLHRELVTERHHFGIAEIKTQIFSFLSRDHRDKEFASLASVCKSWYYSSLDPYIANKQLETTSTLTNEDIENWKIIFENRYKQSLTTVELIQKCPNLKTLDFFNLDIDDEQLKEILEIVKSRNTALKELKFRDCKKLKDPVFKGMNFIQNLDLTGCSSLKAPCLEGMTSLSTLDLSSGGRFAIYKLPDLPSLKTLKLNSCTLSINADFSNIPSLEELDFQDSAFATTSSYSIRGILSIKKISFAYCKNLGNPEISKDFPNLEELNFEGCQDLTRLIMKGEVFSLKTLNFSKCSNVRTMTLSIPTLKNLYLNECEKLEHVDVTRSAFLKCLNLNDCTSLIELKHGPNLQKLFLANCKQLYDLNLPALKRLKMLSLRGWEFTCASLKKMPSLERLDLGNCEHLKEVNFQRLHALQKASLNGCTKLTDIKFDRYHPELIHLSISNCSQITKINLRRAQFIEGLWLNNCTSLKIVNLSRLPHLKKLFIKNCPKLESRAIDPFRNKIKIVSDY